ncbi:hypothetical protein BGZ94_005051 [Podila epigama]|nr:hypothetical protein BGZ94_005051 [Podila epigama]
MPSNAPTHSKASSLSISKPLLLTTSQDGWSFMTENPTYGPDEINPTKRNSSHRVRVMPRHTTSPSFELLPKMKPGHSLHTCHSPIPCSKEGRDYATPSRTIFLPQPILPNQSISSIQRSPQQYHDSGITRTPIQNSLLLQREGGRSKGGTLTRQHQVKCLQSHTRQTFNRIRHATTAIEDRHQGFQEQRLAVIQQNQVQSQAQVHAHAHAREQCQKLNQNVSQVLPWKNTIHTTKPLRQICTNTRSTGSKHSDLSRRRPQHPHTPRRNGSQLFFGKDSKLKSTVATHPISTLPPNSPSSPLPHLHEPSFHLPTSNSDTLNKIVRKQTQMVMPSLQGLQTLNQPNEASNESGEPQYKVLVMDSLCMPRHTNSVSETTHSSYDRGSCNDRDDHKNLVDQQKLDGAVNNDKDNSLHNDTPPRASELKLGNHVEPLDMNKILARRARATYSAYIRHRTKTMA